MSIQLKNITKKEFLLFKENFINSLIKTVSDSNYEHFKHSFYFKQNTFRILRYIDISNINKIKYFFNIDYDLNNQNIMSIWSNELSLKLDYLLLKIVIENPVLFIFDKRLSIYAKRILTLNSIESHLNNYQFLYIDKQLINIVRKSYENKSIYSNLKEINFEYPLNDFYLKKITANYFGILHVDSDKNIILGKHIINSFISIIKEGNITYNDLLINYKQIFNLVENKQQTKHDFFKAIVLETFNKKLFLRERKTNQNFKSITKKNFKNILINYINFYLKSKKISFQEYLKNLKIKHFFSFRADLLNLIESGLSIYNLTYLRTRVKSKNTELIYPKDLNEAMDNLFLIYDYKKDFSKIVNPKKYTHKTKEMILKTNIYYFCSLRDANQYFELTIDLIDLLISVGISEKHIRAFLNKFLNVNNYCYEVDFISDHAISFVFNNLLIKMRNCLKNLKNTIVFKNFFNSILTLQNHDEALNKVIKAMGYISLFEKKLIDYKFNNINIFLSDIELIKNKELENKLIKLKGDFSFNEEFLSYVKSMNQYPSIVKEFENIKQLVYIDYLENNYLNEDIILNKNNFNIGVFKHNSNIGILGSNVKGVCISSYGAERLSQINKNFLNLCIYNKTKGIFLWGLLCRVTNEDTKEVVYILNNLQGSINNHNINPLEVKESIFEILNLLKTKLNLTDILFKNQYFNSVSLTSNKKITLNKDFNLCKKVRLDFNLNEDMFFVLENDMAAPKGIEPLSSG